MKILKPTTAANRASPEQCSFITSPQGYSSCWPFDLFELSTLSKYFSIQRWEYYIKINNIPWLLKNILTMALRHHVVRQDVPERSFSRAIRISGRNLWPDPLCLTWQRLIDQKKNRKEQHFWKSDRITKESLCKNSKKTEKKRERLSIENWEIWTNLSNLQTGASATKI